MLVDILGKINNMPLAKNKALLPLFEAVINSFHSLEELGCKEDSYIKIILERDTSQLCINKPDESNYPIVNITIEDNGIGFNDRNFESFKTSDSTYKIKKGCKGVGRFLWLKAFENVEVESIYKDNNQLKIRKFLFSPIKEPISNIIETNAQCNVETKTRIMLNSFKSPYCDSCPKKMETIALKIIEHCISYFILNTCPKITIMDEFNRISLNQLFKDQICVNTEKGVLRIKEYEFKITHVKLFMKDENKHKIHLCANNRDVMDLNLNKFIPDLEGRIKIEDDKEFIYSGYISGKLLDENVNLNRTGFNLSDSKERGMFDYVNLYDIKKIAIIEIKNYLNEYMEPIKKNKIKKIRKYINNTSPQYKPLLKYKLNKIDEIPPKIKDKDLEIELFKIAQELNLEIKKEGEAFLKKETDNIENLEKYKEEYSKYIERENDFGKSSLAQYIIHRKVILSLLEQGLQYCDNMSYKHEEYIHKLIFPMRTISDEIDYEKHNLWIIDEKLAYHYYLASDTKMKNMDILDVDTDKRPDILIIDNPIAVVNQNIKPYNSVVIIEFKRPMRKNYSKESDNPINQVFNYVKRIRKGGAKDIKGRQITINESTPFYIYIVADLTDNIIQCAEYSALTKTPDNLGFFGYNTVKSINAYIEIISYDKLIDDAKKRNRILFDKLFNPMLIQEKKNVAK